ncbi:MAG: sodium:solute symporter family protein, partial [bacterium]|nr:sodium:solute symporter family protein [bacterium]
MDLTGLGFGPGALALIGLYLVSMIGVGWLGRVRRQSDSMVDFYLAGRSMGFAVLLLTLYATQYSGNTMFGYTGKSYRIGFEWTVSVLFMFSIIVGYLLFAPRLVAIARKADFITPGDYIRHRFRSPVLTLLATVLMIYALGNYTLAQLKAMGAAVEGITDGGVPSEYGIIGLAAIMVIYETLGGMRSVAWTDVIQGIVLLTGFTILLFVIPGLGGGMTHIVETLSISEPAMVAAPSLEVCNSWISFVVLLGCGAAIYPQAIQRLYASKNVRGLKRSLAVMAFLPLTTTLIALFCGLTARVVLPGIEGVETDQVLARLCALIMQQSEMGYWFVVVVFAAALAALMSTADSALLSISSMF